MDYTHIIIQHHNKTCQEREHSTNNNIFHKTDYVSNAFTSTHISQITFRNSI